MSWIRNTGINDQVKALSSDIAAAYVERAQLFTQLISVEPSLSVSEFAAYWAVMAEQISKPMDEASQTQIETSNNLSQSLPIVVRSFFDSFCQTFVKNVLKSDLELRLDKKEIRELVGPVFDSMARERGETIGKIIIAVASNAAALSGAVMLVSQRALTKKEGHIALKHALSVVRSQSNIRHFEKTMAERWLNDSEPYWSMDRG